MKKVILLVTILFMPIFIFASGKKDYTNGLNDAKSYITKGNYKNTYSRYIDCGNYSGSCDKSEFIDREIFESSKKNGITYLFDGVEYWTKNTEGTKAYVVTYNSNSNTGTTILENQSFKYSSRPVVTIKPNVKARGRGTYNNPWTFDPMYQVRILIDPKYSYFAVDEDSVKYVVRGDSVTYKIGALSGYKYITNDCKGTYSNGNFVINNVIRNLNCNVVFGTGKYKITLNGQTPETVHKIIYSNYQDNFYSDEGYTRIISKLDTVPEKTGYKFMGYKLDDGTVVVDSEKNINRQATKVISEDKELNPIYDVSKPATPTITGGGTKVNGHEKIRLTCATTTNYTSDTTKYYSFGYSSTDGGNPGNWTTASTTATYDVPFYRGTKYYSCRVKAVNNSDTSITTDYVDSASTGNKAVTYVNARIDFDATTNGGTLSGTNPLYASYGLSSLYSGRTNTTGGTIPTTTKAGWDFQGWYTAQTGGSKVIDADGYIQASVSGWTNANKQFILTNTANTEGTNKLYAQYKGKTFSATFNKNGATSIGSTTLSCTVSSGSTCTVTAPSITRSGFTIDGWNTSASATTGTAVGASITLSANATYNAITHKGVTITFNKNGNTSQTPSGGSANTATSLTQSCTIRNTQTTCNVTSPTITMSGFTIIGYSTSASDHSNNWSINTLKAVSANATYYAQTRKAAITRTATFNANGQGATISNTTKSCNIAEVFNGASQSTTCNVATSTVTRTYFSCGWATSSTANASVSSGATVSLSGNPTYYAKCTGNTYTVSYNVNGGSGSIGSTSYTYATSGTVALTTTKPTRSGYTFAGWSTSNTATTVGYTSGGAFPRTTASNTTLYALWYRVYSGNGYFTTLGAAVNGTSSGGTITFANSFTDTASISISKNLTINLNGCTLTKGQTITINSGYSVTFNGSGTYTTSAGVPLTNKGTLTLSAGTFTSTANNYIVSNSGTLKVSGATITQNKTSSGVYNAAGASMTLSGGLIQSLSGSLDIAAVENRGSFTMSGGTLKATNVSIGIWHPASTSATSTITGGTITVVSNNAIWNQSGTVNVNGGSISGSTTTYHLISNSGGTLNVDGASIVQSGSGRAIGNNSGTTTITQSSGKTTTIKKKYSGHCHNCSSNNDNTIIGSAAGTINIKGGTITYESGYYGGSAVAAGGGTVTISGGTLRTYSNGTYYGRTLNVSAGTATFSGGTLSYGSSNTNACQVWRSSGTFNNTSGQSLKYINGA